MVHTRAELKNVRQLLMVLDHPEVTLCSRQDVKLQLLTVSPKELSFCIKLCSRTTGNRPAGAGKTAWNRSGYRIVYFTYHYEFNFISGSLVHSTSFFLNPLPTSGCAKSSDSRLLHVTSWSVLPHLMTFSWLGIKCQVTFHLQVGNLECRSFLVLF